jgi:hypothetical protein
MDYGSLGVASVLFYDIYATILCYMIVINILLFRQKTALDLEYINVNVYLQVICMLGFFFWNILLLLMAFVAVGVALLFCWNVWFWAIFIFVRVLIKCNLLVFFSLLEMPLSYFLLNSIYLLFLIILFILFLGPCIFKQCGRVNQQNAQLTS